MPNYKNIEEVLPVGRHTIKVYPAQEWDNNKGQFVRGTHKRTKPNKAGVSGYIYNTDVIYLDDGKERRCTLFAYDPTKKSILDEGQVEVNIVEYYLTEDGKTLSEKQLNASGLQPMKIVDSETNEIRAATKKRVFVNSLNRDPVKEDPQYEGMRDLPDEINTKDIPF